MPAPIVYRWDDSGAPVARGETRSLCDILHACLVTGYGSKAAAGWTREYVNATFDKAAFRNNPTTGTGFYLQVDGLGGVNAYTPKLQGFEVMTSESSGTFPFNAATQPTATSNAAGTTARPWVLIADDRAFYFFCWPSLTAAPTTANYTVLGQIFFGDIISRYATDAYACGLQADGTYGGIGLTYRSDSTVAGALSSTGLAMPRLASGALGSILPVWRTGDGPGSIYMGEYGVAYTGGDPIIIARPYIDEVGAYTFRGWAPGVYYPCHPLAFGQLATVSSDGQSFLSLYIASNGATVGQLCNFFISLSDWRA